MSWVDSVVLAFLEVSLSRDSGEGVKTEIVLTNFSCPKRSIPPGHNKYLSRILHHGAHLDGAWCNCRWFISSGNVKISVTLVVIHPEKHIVVNASNRIGKALKWSFIHHQVFINSSRDTSNSCCCVSCHIKSHVINHDHNQVYPTFFAEIRFSFIYEDTLSICKNVLSWSVLHYVEAIVYKEKFCYLSDSCFSEYNQDSLSN